jgi:hypothetical protein
MLNLIYVILAGAVLAFYAFVEYSGWEYGTPPQRVEPIDSRRSPGWSHHVTTHHFYSGFRGGK